MNNYLFLGSDRTIKKNFYPIDPAAFYKYETLFYAKLNDFFPIINIPDNFYNGIFNRKVYNELKVKIKRPDALTIAIPKNHQFRVHVCTELYKKGVPLKYIQKFMGHLSHEMEGYYVRPTKQSPQENMNFSMETLKRIVRGETKPMGGVSSLMDKINEFIEENHYNVATDLDEICNKLLQKIPIRQKTGGVCIKSSMLRECSKDARTNEFYCAYGVCPNIYHFYYMAYLYYKQAKNLVDTIELNRKNGFMRQVQKELHMLQLIIKNKLNPEIAELKKMVEEKGVTTILMEYPELQYIIENMNKVEEEIVIWKEMKE